VNAVLVVLTNSPWMMLSKMGEDALGLGCSIYQRQRVGVTARSWCFCTYTRGSLVGSMTPGRRNKRALWGW